MADLHMSTEHRTTQFFTYEHLPPYLATVSKPFCQLAHEVRRMLPDNPEKDKALDLLLAAKDAAVRAWLYKD